MSDWHYTLALKREMERDEETITGWILEDLGLFKMELPLGAGPEQQEADLSPHQFTQLVAAAEETESVPALINYLRYQIARSKKGQGWQYANVGAQIIAELEGNVRANAHNAAQCAAERVRGASAVATDEEERRAWVELSRRFLAALRRCFAWRLKEHEREEVTSL
ncbi:MAG TPA: hypothetical protein ENN99_12665 [Chloroflexi bacterium]|nr:hypothetical protein [Chloroflexota bacterium]